MHGMYRRLLPAAGISMLGTIATSGLYYLSTPKVRQRGGAKAIGYLDSDPAVVQRKPSDHLIWEEVKQGEVLFSSDTVRASRRGGARIRMDESGSMIELEPDSVIVLEESQGKLSLNLINGGLFVKNDESQPKEASSLEIRVGGTKLAAGAKGLEMNIRRDKSGKASVAVTKGKVTALAAGKTFDLSQGKSSAVDAKGLATDTLFQVLQPAEFRAIAVKPPEELLPPPAPEKDNSSAIPLTLAVEPEKLAWRDPPERNEDGATPTVKFSWFRGSPEIVRWRLGYSTDAEFSGPKWQTAKTTSGELSLPYPGTFFVKVEGMNSRDITIAESTIRPIKLAPARKLPPPKLMSAKPGSPLMADASGDVELNWRPVEHALGYTVTLRDDQGATVFTKQTSDTHIEIQHLMPGRHTAALSTLNIKSEPSTHNTQVTVDVPAVSAVKPPSTIQAIHIK